MCVSELCVPTCVLPSKQFTFKCCNYRYCDLTKLHSPPTKLLVFSDL